VDEDAIARAGLQSQRNKWFKQMAVAVVVEVVQDE
jgi:hypothetical protein